jgi:glycosyltransferase involved in cell wall biosynthesis
VRNDPNCEYGGKLGGFVGKHMIPHADGCVFQTKEAKSWFPKEFQKKSAVIMNDVDKVFFETERVGGSHIVTLGRLSSQKNQKLLINAYSKIAGKYLETDLMIYGIGALKDELEEQIRTLGLSDRVRLMGLTKDVPTILAHAGYFVLSSDYEGMPNALMEALAIGVPCISTDCPCGGPRTLMKDGENGLLIPVGDESRLIEALDKLLSNQELADRLGQNAKEEAKKYRTEKVFEQWKEYVEEMVL